MINDFEEEYEKEIVECVKKAKTLGWNYTKFKNFISENLFRNNNEDQWIFDYQSWLFTLNDKIYDCDLKQWAIEYYGEDYKK